MKNPSQAVIPVNIRISEKMSGICLVEIYPDPVIPLGNLPVEGTIPGSIKHIRQEDAWMGVDIVLYRIHVRITLGSRFFTG